MLGVLLTVRDDSALAAIRAIVESSTSVSEAEQRWQSAGHAVTVDAVSKRFKRKGWPAVSTVIAGRRAEARRNPELHVKAAPPGYRLKGVSSLVKPGQPEPVLQWVKTSKELDLAFEVLEAMREVIAANPLPARPRAPAPAHCSADLLAVYPMGDPHFGMLSWPEETGNDFNLQIARQHLVSATQNLVGLMPPAEQAWILPLGDLMHSDGYTQATTKGTRVDVDSRYPKMLRVTVDTIVVCIDAALVKHRKARVTIVRGNHDDTVAIAVALVLEHHYRNEPRVTIDSAAQDFHWLEFGANLLGTTHGHKARGQKLQDVMVVDQAQAWGRTRHRHWYTGHVHHEAVKELAGVVVESFRTLAPGDAWHTGEGYRARRGAVADLWHVTRGKILRHEIGVEAIEAICASP